MFHGRLRFAHSITSFSVFFERIVWSPVNFPPRPVISLDVRFLKCFNSFCAPFTRRCFCGHSNKVCFPFESGPSFGSALKASVSSLFRFVSMFFFVLRLSARRCRAALGEFLCLGLCPILETPAFLFFDAPWLPAVSVNHPHGKNLQALCMKKSYFWRRLCRSLVRSFSRRFPSLFFFCSSCGSFLVLGTRRALLGCSRQDCKTLIFYLASSLRRTLFVWYVRFRSSTSPP